MTKSALPARASCEGVAFGFRPLLVVSPDRSARRRTIDLTKTLLAVKLTILLLTVTLVSAHANTVAQEVTISGSNLTYKQVFSIVEKQTGFVVFGEKELLSNKKTITLSVNNLPLQEFLNMILKDQPVEYEIADKTIFISRKPRVASSVPTLVNQTEAAPPITGVVRDADGNPLAGASIRIKGSTSGVSTDVDGQFSIDASVGQVLVISYTGYEEREITVGTSTSISIILSLTESHMEEVTVNAGYYNMKKREATGNISRVDAMTIEKQPVSNPLQALQGRIAGLNIMQRGGIPGSNFHVQIRGRNSIAAGNDPLYIIDGVPYTSQTLTSNSVNEIMPGGYGASPLNSINPNDIESIEILKDADATAIYGSRGGNGVILITTKKGKAGKTQFDLNVSAGISEVSQKMDLLNTQEYLEMRNEAFANDGRTPQSWNYDVNGTWDKKRYTDWQKELIGGQAEFTNIQASISGGDDNTQFLFSGAYQKQGTVFPGDFQYQKGSTHFSVTHISSNKKFRINLLANYIVDRNNLFNRDLASTSISLAPNAPSLYDATGNLNWENSTWENPLSELKRDYIAKTNNLIGNAVLDYAILPGLTIKTNIAFNDLHNNERSITPSTFYNPAWGITTANSNATFNNSSSKSWIIEPQLSWKKKIGNGEVNILLGTSFQETLREGLAQRGTDFSSDELIWDINAAANIDVLSYINSEYRYNAIFGRLNYNLNGKYILNITGRRDGSSRFGPGKQFANFGALGTAWVFSKEKFFINNIPLISFGKIRISYGSSGNDQIGDYEYLDVYGSTPAYQGISGLDPVRLLNPEFAWEINKKAEIGIDIGLLNDKILISASYYRNRTSNQLINYPLPITTGFSGIQSNLPATVENTGLELELNTVNYKKGSISWVSSINITIPRNKLISFPGLLGSTYANQYVVGEPLDISKSFMFLGVDPQTGLYMLADMNGDGAVTSVDRLKVVKTGQVYYGGMNNTFYYKSFQFDVFFQITKQKGRMGVFIGSPPGLSINQSRKVLNRWQKPGDVSDIQQFTSGSNGDAFVSQFNYDFSDANWVDASFVRLKNLSISYQLPERWMKTVKGRIYLQGQNLLTFTRYEGLDPESGPFALPPLRTITAGIQITL